MFGRLGLVGSCPGDAAQGHSFFGYVVWGASPPMFGRVGLVRLGPKVRFEVAGFRGRRPAAMKRPAAATEALIASEAVVTEPPIGSTKRPASKSSSGPSKKAAKVVAVLTLPAEDLEAPVTPPSRKATTKPSGLDRFLKEMGDPPSH